jgi:hypothetical protein
MLTLNGNDKESHVLNFIAKPIMPFTKRFRIKNGQFNISPKVILSTDILPTVILSTNLIY